MYWVYILYSASTDTYYKGQTNNLQQRIVRHNNGLEKYTKKGVPWILIYSISCNERSEALTLERKLKNLSRKRLLDFIENHSANSAGPDLH